MFVLVQITREVELHRYLRHKNVVCFYSYFEDENYVYMILENCSRKVICPLCSPESMTEYLTCWHLPLSLLKTMT